ncbi:MAG TPA: hypothetical protein VD838_22465 [Anaeromyxobacteraceae bacterium]|nr:hypothetical protein [Anaeromyxobacteraceae bacterium]
MDRAAARALVERFVRERPGSLLHDASADAVLDVASGKVLAIDWTHVTGVEERTDRETGRPWLAIQRDDGREVALADQGVAFAPETAATGPLEGLPPAVGFRDLATVEARLRHFLVDHPDEPADRSHVALFMLLLAGIDGARAIGFDVSAEERRIERILGELEARRRR